MLFEFEKWAGQRRCQMWNLIRMRHDMLLVVRNGKIITKGRKEQNPSLSLRNSYQQAPGLVINKTRVMLNESEASPTNHVAGLGARFAPVPEGSTISKPMI